MPKPLLKPPLKFVKGPVNGVWKSLVGMVNVEPAGSPNADVNDDTPPLKAVSNAEVAEGPN